MTDTATLEASTAASYLGEESVVDGDVEVETVAELAVLTLARVDGKSPVEYADESTRARLREVAARWLREAVETASGFADVVRGVLTAPPGTSTGHHEAVERRYGDARLQR